MSRQTVQLLAGAAGNAAVSRLVAQRFVAPVSPSVSQAPGMRRVSADVAAKRARLGAHRPAVAESGAAQDAAVAPPDDREAQGKVANSAKMDAAKPGAFDKAAFVKAVNDAIAAQAPKNLDEADKFSKSGRAEKIKGAVDGKVTAGKTASAHDISSATAAPPDTSAAKDKTVVPLRPDQPPANPGAPSAADAAPAPQPAAVTDFSPGPKQTDEQMKSADVTDDQLAKSNEPDFTGALKDKKQADAHSATAPGKARGAEKQQIAAAKSSAAVTGAQAMAQLTATRHTAGKAVDSGKGGAKSKDESRRSEATARLQKVFDATKRDVEAILSGLDKKVDTQFNAGEAKARAAFEADQKARMSAYKHKRYGGWLGGAKWAKDKLMGMPKEANDLFQLSRQLYVTQMQSVISSVADTIGTDLGAAKSRIAKGRSDLAAEVKKLPADLRKFGQDAAKDFAGKFDDLESDVDDKSKQLVQTLATKYTQALHKVDEEIKKLQDANKGLVSKAVGAIAGVIKTITELKNLLMGILAKAATAISKIIKNPIGFLNNLVHAVGAGLKLFVANIADHLKKGLVSWLLGTAVKAGLNLPSSFDLKGIIQLITGLLGLTWANIRARITAKGIPDQAMTEVEKSVPVAQKLAKEGPAGVEQEIVKETGDLKATILGKLTTYLIPTVIIAGITWILSLLNPASAFVRAVKAIVDIVSFVINQGAQVAEFVNAVLDAVIAIANGGTAGVPKMVETALAAAIPTLLGLLASLLGIGNLAAKVKSVFHAVAKPVNRVIDKIVTFIAKMGKKIWAKLKSKFGKKKDGTRARNDLSPERKMRAKKNAADETQQRLSQGVEVGTMKTVLQQVYAKYKNDGVSLIRMVRAGPYSFRAIAHGSAGTPSTGKVHVQDEKDSNDPEGLRLTPAAVKTFTMNVRSNYSQALQAARDELLKRGEKWEEEKSFQLPTDARGVLQWNAGSRVRRHQSSEPTTQKTHVHHVDGAHAEEQVTNLFQKADLPELKKDKDSASKVSARWEVNRSPCVNCANYIADFVENNLRDVSGDARAEVAASALYQGEVDFTGEIRQAYPEIFDRFLKAKRISTEKEIGEKIAEQEKAKLTNPNTSVWDPIQKRFSGHPSSATPDEAVRREEQYEDLPEGEVDHRRDWFRIHGGYASGRAGIAILLNRGIAFMKLGPSDLDLTSLGQDLPEKQLAEYTVAELIEKERRERFIAAMDQSIKKMLRLYDKEVAIHLKEQEKAQAGSAASEVEAEGKAGDASAAT
ncbi:hypothetical protein [Streptomyces sp. NPDC021020]|uniref:hypothetical protein n=1 Tax=Streptomyces sp. NPDC021020 TaxID=3365109 RepID=UPI0037BBBAD5